ncbi:MAG: RNA methyltransferase [bacterium]
MGLGQDYISITRSHADELRTLVRDSAEREATRTFVIEGPHLLQRASEDAPHLVRELIVTEKALEVYSDLIQLFARKKVGIQVASPKLAELISDTKSPQGIFAVVEMPDADESESPGDIVIALDDVQDPGNVGTIIRSAAWFGAEQVYLSDGCADPYSPKVVRATQGEIFSVSVGNRGRLLEKLVYLHSKGYQVVCATLEQSACSLYEMTFATKMVIVFGSEAHGVSNAILQMADAKLVIPKYGAGESLNVAMSAAVILSEIARKRSTK